MTSSNQSPSFQDVELDVSGLQCPLPVLKARKRLSTMKNGEILKVIATDPAAGIDFPHFCNEAGHKLIDSHQDGNALIFIIQNCNK